MINLIISIVVIGLIFWLLWWLLDYIKIPEPFNKVAKVILALAAVVYVIRLLMRIGGVSL